MPFLQQRIKSYQQDLFDRANGALGSAWSTLAYAGGDSSKVPVIFSNGIRNEAVTTTGTVYQGIAIYNEPLVNDNFRMEWPCMNANHASLLGGVVARASADFSDMVAFVSNGSQARIQYRLNGATFASPASTVAGNHFTTGDIFVVECVDFFYQLKRIRSGTETLIAGWNDSTGIYPRVAGNARVGYFGSSERTFFPGQAWGLQFTQMTAWNI